MLVVIVAFCCSLVDVQFVGEQISCCGPVNLSTAALSIYMSVCLCLCLQDLHSCVCVCMHALCVFSVCVSLRQLGLSSLDNQSLALVRQPSEAERSKAEADDHHSVCMCVCVFLCSKGSTALVVLRKHHVFLCMCTHASVCTHACCYLPSTPCPTDSLAGPGIGGEWKKQREGWRGEGDRDGGKKRG